MGNLKLMIDGKEVFAKEGMTILQAAEKAGIYIPTLCHKVELSPIGACRICVVEVEGAKNLVGACHTPVEPGMVIRTKSPRVLETRKVIIQLLLASHTGPCVTDEGAEACELHSLASELEVSPPLFFARKPRFYLTEEVSPYIKRDLSRCILCRRCVRACSEVAGENLYSIAYRGFHSKVVVDFDEPLNKEVCKDCGVCVDFCPTTALSWVSDNQKGYRKHRYQSKAVEENRERSLILKMLKEEQRKSRYISKNAMERIASELCINLSEVYGVATFYSFLTIKPQGRHVIRICNSVPCHLRNGPMVIDAVQRELGIGLGGVTPDGRFSFELTNCIGACDTAPAMMVDNDVYGDLTPEKIVDILRSYD